MTIEPLKRLLLIIMGVELGLSLTREPQPPLVAGLAWAHWSSEITRWSLFSTTEHERVYACDLLHSRGGEWLGAARSWMQQKKHNGERVRWGSSEELRPPVTVREIEEVAAEAAAAAFNEARRYETQVEKLREKYLKIQIELEIAQAKIARLEKK